LHKFRSTLLLDVYGRVWTCEPTNNGSVTQIWNPRCAISNPRVVSKYVKR
jgi:hypothetical protein